MNRAYNVANAIRFANSPDRRRLGWIAVSGEDDQPHRPVNVPSGEFPQYDLTVTVPVRGCNGMTSLPPITLTTRYMIAQPPPGGLANAPRDSGRQVPADAQPVLDPDAEVILFIHGMDSRLTNQPLYLQNNTRMLLACGYDDTGGNLCENTRTVAWKMTNTPGRRSSCTTPGTRFRTSGRTGWRERSSIFWKGDRPATEPVALGNGGAHA